MGKKKQKVRWCLVDGLKWSNTEEDSSSEGSVSGKVAGNYPSGGSGNYGGGPTRRASQPWLHGGVAPRFEKRSQANHNSRQVYYDGEYCDAEELPNGFTKIRSKNLDILFKREYYEQKLRHNRPKEPQETSAPESDSASNSSSIGPSDSDPQTQDQMETQPQELTTTSSPKPFRTMKSFESMDPADIQEFKPMHPVPETTDSMTAEGEQSPAYYPPGGFYEQAGGGYNYPGVPPRPNLYLYSPSNNTLIPCEEIVIPNPAMQQQSSSSEGGPVYNTAPANIYLAYPVSGPDGRGYITQPFSPPLPQGHHHPDYMSYPCYSPSISVDGSQYHSSTPQTPNSGQDSGSSTQPTSPPPLVNYHPSNWFEPPKQPEQQLPPQKIRKDCCPKSSLIPEPIEPGRIEPDVAAAVETPTIQYIPGLPPASTPKKSQKKKKKKKQHSSEHRDSLSSESELSRMCAGSGKESLESYASSPVGESYASSPVVEVNLTDDLADCMVNPPTDPEVSDEETLKNVSENVEIYTTEIDNNLGSIPRDDTMCNLEELSNESIAEDHLNGLTESKSVVFVNLIDSGIERDFEDESSSTCCLKSDTDAGLYCEADAPDANSIDDTIAEADDAKKDVVDDETIQFVCLPLQEAEPETRAADIYSDIPSDLQTSPDIVIDKLEQIQSAELADDVEEKDEHTVGEATITKKEILPVETAAAVDNVSQEFDSSQQQTAKGKLKRKRSKKKPVASLLKPEAATSSSPVTTAPTTVLPEIPSEPFKLSYSAAVCKHRDQQSSQPPTTASTAAPTINKSKSVLETKPSADREQQPAATCPDLRTGEEGAAALNCSGEWESVPASLSHPGEWEKRKEKKRKKKKNSVNFEETPQIIEVEKEEEGEEDPEDGDDLPPPLESVKLPSPPLEAVKRSSPPPLEESAKLRSPPLSEQDGEEEKKRVKKKKKKSHNGKEQEETGHKVVICDNQIEIRFSRSVRRAADVLGAEQIDAAKTSGYCDILLIQTLGCGISRGSMHNGRLYQGRYVPPERVDGLKVEDDITAEIGEDDDIPGNIETFAPLTEEIDLD